jgi:hypothetical protein
MADSPLEAFSNICLGYLYKSEGYIP